MVNDDDDGVKIDEVISNGKNDDEFAKKSSKDEGILSKDNEPKVNINSIPFPQRFIRRNLDKQFGKFLDRKSTRLNSSHSGESRMPSSA